VSGTCGLLTCRKSYSSYFATFQWSSLAVTRQSIIMNICIHTKQQQTAHNNQYQAVTKNQPTAARLNSAKQFLFYVHLLLPLSTSCTQWQGYWVETDRISATVSAPKLLKMSFGPGFGHESFGQATATAETGDWFRPAAECVYIQFSIAIRLYVISARLMCIYSHFVRRSMTDFMKLW